MLKPGPGSIKLKQFINYIALPCVIFFCVFQSNFIHGFIEHLEEGRELGCLNELFYGKTLYRDVFTYRGPLYVYLQGFFMSLFGLHLGVLRGLFFFGNIANLIIAYFLCLSLCRKKLFAYLSALFLAIETFHPFWATRWGGLRFGLGLLALLCLVNFFKRGKHIWVFFTGILCAIAFLTSIDIGVVTFIAAGFSLAVFVIHNLKDKPSYYRGIAASFTSGAFLIFIPCLVLFAYKRELLPYIDILMTISANFLNVWGQKNINLWEVLITANPFSLNYKYIFLLMLYASSGVYLFYCSRKSKLTWVSFSILALTIYGMLMYKASLRSMSGPQFSMALQPAIILTFIFMDKLFENALNAKGGGSLRRIVPILLILVMWVYLVFSEKVFYKNFRGWLAYELDKNNPMTAIAGNPGVKLEVSEMVIERAKGIKAFKLQIDEIESVTRYIQSLTHTREPVFTFPEQAMYNFFADRPIVGRFPIGGEVYLCEKYKRELLESIKKEKPRVVVLSRIMSYLAQSIGKKDELLPEVFQFVWDNYDLNKRFATVDVYLIKQ